MMAIPGQSNEMRGNTSMTLYNYLCRGSCTLIYDTYGFCSYLTIIYSCLNPNMDKFYI